MLNVIAIFIRGIFLAIIFWGTPLFDSFKDTEVNQYVDEYVRIAELFGHDKIGANAKELKIVFRPLGGKQIGVCYTVRHEIAIDREVWATLPVENKEELMFHELTHCLFDQYEHTEDGIMRANGLFNPETYRKTYKILINDLFGCETLDCVEISWYDNKYKPLLKESNLTKSEILNNKHAVVRFTATWCPPCKVLAPIFDEVASRYPDVKTYVVDVDQYQDLARDFNVRGIPTLIQIKNNNIEATTVGAQPKEKVEELFK